MRLRISGSAGTTGFLSLSSDGTLLTIDGPNSSSTSGNANSLSPRGVGTLNSAGTFNLATTYTGVSGQQERSSTTFNNTNFFIADQQGLYTNGATTTSVALNLRSISSFGGTVYVCSAATSGISSAVSSVPSLTATAAGRPFRA